MATNPFPWDNKSCLYSGISVTTKTSYTVKLFIFLTNKKFFCLKCCLVNMLIQRALCWSAWLSARQAPSPLQLLLQSKPPPTCTFTPAPCAPGVANTACLAHGDASIQLGHPKDNCPLPTWSPCPCILTSMLLSPPHTTWSPGELPHWGWTPGRWDPCSLPLGGQNTTPTAKGETGALKVGGDDKSRDHGKNFKRPITSMLGQLCGKGYSL